MADLRPYPQNSDESGTQAEQAPTTRTRRWGKMLLKILLVLVVLAPIVIHLILIGGPGRHVP